jgi:multicomponent Na+:H+ antiporter subunit F
MTEFLFLAAGLVMAIVAVGLVRVIRGPTDADRMMAAQLLGTGGVAALLMVAAGLGNWAVVDAALALAVLAAFASVAFVHAAPDGGNLSGKRR